MAKKKTAPVPHQLSEQFAEPDLVDRIFDYFLELHPEIASDKVEQMKTAMREEFGGTECYIPTRSPTERQQLVVDVLRMFNGRNASEVARRLNTSRATVYRLYKQHGHQKPSHLSET